MNVKWIAPLAAYAAVVAGIFFLRSAWGALIIFHIAIAASLLFAKPNIPPSLLFRSNDRKWIILSFMLCGSVGIGLYFFRSSLGLAKDISTQLEMIGLHSSTWPLFIAYFTLVNPFIEEYFWRGYLGSPARGFQVSDAVFAGYHMFLLIGKVTLNAILFAFVLLTLAGWFWRQVARQDQGMLASVLGHMAADFSILMALYWISLL